MSTARFYASKDNAKYKAALDRNRGKHIAKMQAKSHQPALQQTQTSANKNSLVTTLFFLGLLAGGYYVAANRQTTIHGKPVNKLPGNSKCSSKTSGKSKGKVCLFDGKKQFLKETALAHSNYEAFSREHIASIGVRTPHTLFYQQRQSWLPFSDTKYYIAGEEIPDFVAAASYESLNDPKLLHAIGPDGLAKLTVATSFVFDIHKFNWGHDKNGLVIIDLDSNHVYKLPIVEKRFAGFAGYCLKEMHPALSLGDIEKMIAIYRKMQHTPLPNMNSDYLPNDVYTNLLKIYIKACRSVLKNMAGRDKKVHDLEVNRQLARAMESEAFAFEFVHRRYK